MGRVREEKRRRKKIKKEKVSEKKKIQVREKVGKPRNSVFCQWFAAPDGRKVGSLKRRVRSHLARWEMKSCTPLWRKAHVQVKMHETHQGRTTFGSWDVENCTRRCGRSTFRSQKRKNWGVRSSLGRSDVVFRGRRRGLCTLSKVSKTGGFCSSFNNHRRHGKFEEDLERCIALGRRSTRDTWGRRSGRRFPERGCILEHQIVSFGKMILRDKCSTSYDLASLFRGRRSTLDRWRWSGKHAKRIGTRPSALHSVPFLKEVSQNCFVFDLANLENWESLAELLRFWRCQLQKLRKSDRIAAFLTLSSSKIEEVSQSRRIASLSSLQIDRWMKNYNYNYHYHYTTTTYTTATTTTTLHYTTLITAHYVTTTTTTTLQPHYNDTTTTLQRHYNDTTTTLQRHYYHHYH